MVERLIELSAKHKWIVFGIVLVLTAWAVDSVRKTPLDALPDISDPQVIAFLERWTKETPLQPEVFNKIQEWLGDGGKALYDLAAEYERMLASA